MAAPPAADYEGLIHYIWEFALSVLGGYFMRRWNRMEDRLEDKVDKEELLQLKEEIKEEIKEFREDQREQHRENRGILFKVLDRLPPRDDQR